MVGAVPAGARASDCLPFRVGNQDGNDIVSGVQGRIVDRRAELSALTTRKGGDTVPE